MTSWSGYTSVHTTIVELTGENTRRWCNGMFSNNFRAMQPTQNHRSAICDDRGRVKGFIDALCISDTQFLCTFDGITLEEFNGRFQMYMMLDDMELEERSSTLCHIFGNETTALLNELELPVPEKGEAAEQNGIWISRRSRLKGHEGFDILSGSENTDALKAIVERLHAKGSETTTEQFENLRILSGTPQFPADFTDKSFIHDYDLQDDVCSFNKGCYVGQEIINRMDIKKLATKKLLRIQLDGAWTIGETIMLDGKKVGSMTSMTSDGTLGLALLRKTAWETGTALASSEKSATVL